MNNTRLTFAERLVRGRLALTLLVWFGIAVPTASSAQSATGYLPTEPQTSEFDNLRTRSAPPPLDPSEPHQDTEFGELMYNESSLATRLELLRLLSKQTPSLQVYLHAVSMGVGVDDMLRAAGSYYPKQSRQMLSSAINVLPLLDHDIDYGFGDFQLEDIERDREYSLKSDPEYRASGLEDEQKRYLSADVVERFFDGRNALRPAPDWLEGEYHFKVSAAELLHVLRNRTTEEEKAEIVWYQRPADRPALKRPLFVSLYDRGERMGIDGDGQMRSLTASESETLLPVVFIFNRENEIGLTQLVEEEYPLTIRGVRDAYQDRRLMLTPVPEWDLGDYHIMAELEEIDQLFDLPIEDDFEPEHWQALLAAARKYRINDTSFLFVVLPNSSGDEADEEDEQVDANKSYTLEYAGPQYAAWDDPRTEEAFPYVVPRHDDDDDENQRRRNEDDDRDYAKADLGDYMGDGVIVNRPDLLAALLHLRDELAIQSVPAAFYYVDKSRVRAFRQGPIRLRRLIEGVTTQPPPRGTGGFGPTPENPPPECASPPCSNL